VLDDSGLEINAIVETFPELEKVDVTNIAIERPDVSVVDSDVAEMLETLKKQRITWNDVDRKPLDGDQALVEYTAKTDAGTIPEKGNLRLAIILGESGFEALEKATRKMSPGDQKDIKLEFPADFREQALAGKKADVSLTLSKVQEKETPEIDEEFVKSFGVDSGETVAMLKSSRQKFAKTWNVNWARQSKPISKLNWLSVCWNCILIWKYLPV